MGLEKELITNGKIVTYWSVEFVIRNARDNSCDIFLGGYRDFDDRALEKNSEGELNLKLTDKMIHVPYQEDFSKLSVVYSAVKQDVFFIDAIDLL